MSESFSQAVLIGSLRQRVHVETLPSGTPCGTFELILRERTSAGRWYSTVVACQLWGKTVEAARELQPGQTCLFHGKLAKRKRGEDWHLVVSGFTLEALTIPTAVDAPAYAHRN